MLTLLQHQLFLHLVIPLLKHVCTSGNSQIPVKQQTLQSPWGMFNCTVQSGLFSKPRLAQQKHNSSLHRTHFHRSWVFTPLHAMLGIIHADMQRWTYGGTFGGGRSTFTWVLYLSALFESVIIIFFWKPMTFTSLLWLRQISFFSLHYISIKILEVERCYHVAALKVSGWIFFFSIFFSDSLSVITLVVTLHCRKEHGVESNWESLY